jgi:DNA polymerase-3 subunit beta
MTLPVTACPDFSVTANAFKMADICKKAPSGDDLAIDALDIVTPEPGPYAGGPTQGAKLDFGGLRVSMEGLPVSEFPEMEMTGKRIEWDMPTADFRAALEAVAFAISTEETRYYLNGIYMHMPEAGTLRMVATDGHRLGRHDVSVPMTEAIPGVIVPHKCVKHLLKLTGKGSPDTLKVIVNTVKVMFIIGNVTVLSKLIDGTFPDYNRVMPTTFQREVTFNRAAMIEGVKAVGCVSSERGRAVKLSFESSENIGNREGFKATLSVNNPDLGNATYGLQVEGEAMNGFEMGCNQSYLLDILNADDAETVTFKLTDCSAPILISGRTDYVLMPMRV